MSLPTRAASLFVVPLLAVGGLTSLATAPANAAAPDPSAVEDSATWLESQLTNGLVHNNQFDFDDYGLSIDVALGLDAVGGHDTAVQATADAIATNIDSYTGYDIFPAPASGVTRHVSAGSIAKALAFAEQVGRNGADFGGQNLVTDLEAQVNATGATLGRLQDTFNPTSPGDVDFANTIGQAFGAQGLKEVNSTKTLAVTDFLLKQQCTEGFFRLNFSAADAADQTCDGDPAAAADTDVTAIAMLALQNQKATPAVAAALTKAATWLKQTQAANGSFGGGTATEAANTNSTGLAGWALGVQGETVSAEKAATYVRFFQANDCENALVVHKGAIAYDAAARGAGAADGIVATTQDQWRRATSQAIPALQWAPLTGTGPITQISKPDWVHGSDMVKVSVTGATPGTAVCFFAANLPVLVQAFAGANGQAIQQFQMPGRTTTYRVTATTRGGVKTIHNFKVLAKTKLKVDRKAKVAKGGTQVVQVNGLAAGEPTRVKFGKRVIKGEANSRGAFNARFKVGTKLGKAKVIVLGRFTDRRGVAKFTITR